MHLFNALFFNCKLEAYSLSIHMSEQKCQQTEPFLTESIT
jgi:hypothetical protein